MDFVDICIIGSGFGGAITAARIARYLRESGSGRTVRVLERGNDHSGKIDPDSLGGPLNAQGNRWRQTLSLDYYKNIVSGFTDPEGALGGKGPTFSVVGGQGIGGGSNMYLGIKLRAASEIFHLARDGRALWPGLHDREALDPYYDAAESMFRVHRYEWTDRNVPHWQLCPKRDYVFAQGCAKIGATAVPLKGANVNDANEGWWSQGQRFQGRQHLSLNYLAEAKAAGAEIHSGCEVEKIHPDGARYVVDYVDHRTSSSATRSLAATLVIVAGGAVGSTGLLMRSSSGFRNSREFSEHLGKHVSGNADYGVVGIVGPEYKVEGHKGKPMAAFTPTFWPEHKFLIVPFYAPAMGMGMGQPATLVVPENPSATGRASTGPSSPDWGQKYKDTLKQFGSRIMTMACVGLDECEGEVSVGLGGKIHVKWPTTHPNTEKRWSTAVTKMRAIFNALGGELFLDAYRHTGHVIAPHPLGGCRMATSSSDGVVDPFGEVFGNRNLFVVDGAIVPSALGIHPSLTICALAERISDQLINGSGDDQLDARLD